MYKILPQGINTKLNDRNVPDGFLQESINLQWREGAFKPIPERLTVGIENGDLTEEIIIHKVSDEDQINVLSISSSGVLYWFGTIIDGVYATDKSKITGFPTITDMDSLSFTILNGLLYFMSSSQEFYYRVQYDETEGAYEVKDMYAWKDLIPYYPEQNATFVVLGTPGDLTHMLTCRCGVILFRYTLVLKTGEEVLHSPIYASYMYSVNTSETTIEAGDALDNIFALVSTNFEFSDMDLYEEEVSAINIYACVPYYEDEVISDVTDEGSKKTIITDAVIKSEVQRMAEEPFYLVKTMGTPGEDEDDDNILFYVDSLDEDLDFAVIDAIDDEGNITSRSLAEYTETGTGTISAGKVMPSDDYSHHKLFGRITALNGRVIVDQPKTVLSDGQLRPLALSEDTSKQGYYIETEDGTLKGEAFSVAGSMVKDGDASYFRGLLSYPDTRATYAGAQSSAVLRQIYLHKLRANEAHNLACAFDFDGLTVDEYTVPTRTSLAYYFTIGENLRFEYSEYDILEEYGSEVFDSVSYNSNNRIQFSESGEFSVWPVENSYRVGAGKIMFVGANSVDPANSDFLAPLLIGTSDGLYSANFDSTGSSLIQTITKIANMPALSSNNLQIDQNLIYISDKGLIAVNNGKLINLTKSFFPDQGDGDFPLGNTVYPNYNTLTASFFGGVNPYLIPDIVNYLKTAVFAYDGRRNNVWCCGADADFSLVYNLETEQWTVSTYVFSRVVDFLGTLTTTEGDIFSRYLVRNGEGDMDTLSGEDTSTEVYTHLLTRPIKIKTPDQYKKIQRLISRCELYRDSLQGNFYFGVWGKQDLNKQKVNVPLVAYLDDTETAFPDGIRQDIPVGRQKGKYKAITIMQGGLMLPSSSLDGFEIVAIPVDDKILR